MYNVKNFTDNDDVKTLEQKGPFTLVEYTKDLSVDPDQAIQAYFQSKMNIRRRQVICSLARTQGVVTQAGAMQWMAGNVDCSSGVKGAGDLLGKFIKSSVTNETAVKPEYNGDGILVLEPTTKHLLTIDVSEWGPQGIVLDDGLFLVCEKSLQQKIVSRANVSSALLGGMGLFNLSLVGNGIACIESECPKEELIEITLNNDVLKVDGSLAVAWSGTLNFTTERTTKSLLGSYASGEGLVNVYRGSGKVLLMPTKYYLNAVPGVSTSTSNTSPSNATGGVVSNFVKSAISG